MKVDSLPLTAVRGDGLWIAVFTELREILFEYCLQTAPFLPLFPARKDRLLIQPVFNIHSLMKYPDDFNIAWFINYAIEYNVGFDFRSTIGLSDMAKVFAGHGVVG